MYSIFGANGAQKPLPAAFCFFPLGTWKNGKKWFICCFLKTGPFVSFSGNMVLLVLLAAWLPWATAYGPVFLQTPPAEVLYSNNTGLVLDCLARGDPPPIIDWVDANGHVLSIHPSVARWENSIQCDPTKTGLGDKGFGLCLPKKQRSVGERPRCKCIFPIIDFWLNLSLCTVNCTMAPCTCCHSLKIPTASSFTNSTTEEASITSQGSGAGPPMPTGKSSQRLSASSQVITVVFPKAWTLGDAFSPLKLKKIWAYFLLLQQFFSLPLSPKSLKSDFSSPFTYSVF